MPDIDRLAQALFGGKRAESQEVATDATTRTYIGTATSDSEGGTVTVDLGGDVTLPDDMEGVEYGASGVEVPTGPGVREGDEVIVTLVGGGPLKTPMVTGVAGEGDRQNLRIGNIEADYVKASRLEAEVADIGFLKADSATITDLQADTAKVHSLTAEQLSAATAYIAALNAGSVTAESLVADVAKVHDLTADQLSAAAGYIAQLTADDVTAQSISAMYGDFATVKANAAKVANLTAQELEADHATIANLDATYAEIDLANVNNAWIENGTIRDAAIGDAQILGVSANKLTAGTIDAAEINVMNLRADNLKVSRVNGQPVIGGYSLVDPSGAGYAGKNPKAQGWYELGSSGYVLTNDTSVVSGKAYYTTSTSVELYDQAYIDGLADDLNDRIDGAIETFTGTVVPTLNNTPASAWTTTKLRDEHVGDVYYVVNSSSQQNGYCYRFTKSGSSYSWQLIKDSDVTAALSRLQTAEGKITTFDSDISTLKTDTGELKTKTQSLETSLGDKVDVTTFNELSSDVEENSASITTLSNTVSQKADSSTVSTLSNTVNTVQQTATGNSSKISQLTQTLGTNADGTTKANDIVHRTSAVEQDLSGFKTTVSSTYATKTALGEETSARQTAISQLDSEIALRATKTEAYQSAQPNLSPFFSMPFVQHDDYWSNLSITKFTQLEDGWAHFEYTNTGSSTVGNYISPNAISTLLPGGNYTLLAEFRNVTISGATNGSFYSQQISSGQIWGTEAYGGFSIDNSQLIALENGEGKFYKSLTLLDAESKDPNGTVRGTLPKTIFMTINQQVTGGQSVSYDLRLSLYEGEYSGPYKPYSGTQLYATSAEMKVASDNIDLKVSKNDVINQINVSTEGATIAANRVNIEGAAIFSSGRLSQTSLNNAYDAKGAAATVQENLDNLQIGGRNLLRDSAFQYSLGQYWVADGVTASISNGTLIIEGSGGSGNKRVYQGLKWFRHSPDTTYAFSCDVVASAACQITFGRKYAGCNEYHVAFDVTTSVKRVSGVYTATNNAAFCIGQPTNNATVTISNIKLENGNKATDWTPAPEDVDAQIDAIQVGGRNLLLRTGTGFSDFAINSTSFVTHHMYSTGTTDTAYDGKKLADFGLEAGDQVTLSFDWSTSQNGSNTIRYGTFHTEFYGVKADGTNGYTAMFGTKVTMSASNSSGHYAQTVALTSLTVNTLRMVMRIDNSCLVMAVSNVKLEKGNKATDWTPAPEDTVKRTQRIWYRKSASGAPSAPTSWVSKADDGTNAWTKMHVAISSTEKYIYTCEQYEMAGGTLGNTSILLDNTITVIDGGKIITGSVTANALSANSVTADKIAANALTLGKFTAADKLLVDNSQVVVGGRNLLKWTQAPTYPGTNYAITADPTSFGGWTRYATAVTIERTEEGIKATHNTSSTKDGFAIPLVAYNAATGGEDLAISFEYRTNMTSIGTPYLLVSTNTGGTTGNTVLSRAVSVTSSTSEWQKFSDIWNFPVVANKVYSFLLLSYVSTSGGWIEIKDGTLKLEKGNKPTDWTPAPEDQQSYVDASVSDVQTEVTQISDEQSSLSQSINQLKTDMADFAPKDAVEALQTLTSWLTFVAEGSARGLTIGDSNGFNIRETGTSLEFRYLNALLASASGNVFDAPNMVTQNLMIGNYAWVPIGTDGIALKYIGG